MTNKFQLKDGRTARIELWDFKQLEDHVSQDLSTYYLFNLSRIKCFEGFTLLGPYSAVELGKGREYSEEENLTPLEYQTDRTLPVEAYHRSLAALDGEDLAGILVCEWVKKPYLPFWHYLAKFIDVRKHYKNLGVGTNLVKALSQADFLKGRIFCTGGFLPEGKRYIKHIFERELKAEDYAIIYPNPYFRGEAEAPKEFGVYDLYRKLRE